MNLPFVSRRAHDEAVAQLKARAEQRAEDYCADLAERNRRYDILVAQHRDLLDKYHALRMAGANPAPVVPALEPIEPDTPPDVVLEAMRTISPTKDKTYEANWAYWEQHKERAAQHPDAFADEILYGTASWQPPTRTLSAMALPDEPSTNGRTP